MSSKSQLKRLRVQRATKPERRRGIALPTPAPAPTAKTAETAPDYKVIVGLKNAKLPQLAAQIRELDGMKAEIEKKLKAMKLQAGELLQKADVKVVMAGGLRVTRVDGVSVSISKTLLVENGVDPGVIAKSTKRTNWLSCKVTAPGENDKQEKQEGE